MERHDPTAEFYQHTGPYDIPTTPPPQPQPEPAPRPVRQRPTIQIPGFLRMGCGLYLIGTVISCCACFLYYGLAEVNDMITPYFSEYIGFYRGYGVVNKEGKDYPFIVEMEIWQSGRRSITGRLNYQAPSMPDGVRNNVTPVWISPFICDGNLEIFRGSSYESSKTVSSKWRAIKEINTCPAYSSWTDLKLTPEGRMDVRWVGSDGAYGSFHIQLDRVQKGR